MDEAVRQCIRNSIERHRAERDPVWFAERVLGIEKLDPWQAELLSKKPQRYILNCHRQSGKALDISTEIPTPDGWKRMGDLQRGDVVFDEKGAPTVIRWVSPIMQHDCYAVRFSDRSEIVADRGHLWTTLDYWARAAISRDGGEIPADWATWESSGLPHGRDEEDSARRCAFDGCTKRLIAKGLCAGHYRQQRRGQSLTALVYADPVRARTMMTEEMELTLTAFERGDTNHSIPSCGPLQCQEVMPLLVDPYVLGYWLGDGTTTVGTITVGAEDVNETQGRIEAAGYEVARKQYASSRSGYTLAVRGLTTLLRTIGVKGNKHIPTEYLRANVEARKALLAGLLDSDGCVSARTNRCEFCTTDGRLAKDTYELATSLGIIVSWKTGRATLYGKDCGEKHRLFFTPPFNPFRLERKAARLNLDGPRKQLRRMRFVVDVADAGTRLVKCISVEAPSGLFLAGRAMVPTHNSTCVAVDALHTAAFEPGSLVLLLSPSLRQSQELFRKVAEAYRRVEGMIPADSDLKLTLELKNGSRIVSLPGTDTTIRGFSGARLVLVDEAARVEDALYEAVRPMLAVSGGRLGMLSTPFGQQGFFYRTWAEGEPKLWYKVKVTADQCPRISAEFLANERAEMGDWSYFQEYMAEFMEDEFAAFSFADVDKAMRGEVVEEWKL